jgi:hypothetical protein
MSQDHSSRIDAEFRSRELADLIKVLGKPFNQSTIDKWLGKSSERLGILQDTFWGRIRWPKSLGRSPGNLSDGFTLTLKNHFSLYYAGPGGEIIEKSGWINMAPPNMWDAPDDETHYRVNYFGHYARYNLTVNANELNVEIVGSWDNPTKLRRYLLPSPLGFVFGSFDGHPIVLDEITVEQHYLTPKSPWAVKI